MTLQCLHTGCIAYSHEYGCYFRGDLYQTHQGTYIFKAVPKRFYPPEEPNRYHMTIHNIDVLWELSPWWVIVVEAATYYDYEGRPTTKAANTKETDDV